MKLLKTTAIAALISFTITSNTNAQSWPAVAPLNPDELHMINPSVSYTTTLNAEVLDLGGGKFLKAIAYEEDPSPGTGTTWIFLKNNSDSMSIPVGSNVQQLDMAFVNADPLTVGCTHYNLLVVYIKNGIPYYSQIDINNPTGSMSGGIVKNFALTVKKNINNAVQPHIDAFPDPLATMCTGSKLRKAVVTWSEDSGTGYNIYAAVTDLDNPTPLFTTPLIIDQGINSDVAAVTDKGTTGNPQTAYFIYYDRTKGSIKHADWDISTTTVNTYPALETGTFSYCPRIEAQNLGAKLTGLGQTPILWEAVAQVNQTGLEEVHAYGFDKSTGIISKDNYASSLSPINTYNHYMPSVAAGQGGYTVGSSSAIGNNSFTIGWYMGTSNTIEALQISNALPSTVLAGFSQVNQTALGTGPVPASAFANSAGNGNYLLSGWNTDLSIPKDAIALKLSTSFAFKTTAVNTITGEDKLYIYPNPAKDLLHVYNTGNCDFVVKDIIGRPILSGTLQNNDLINTSSLAPGTYLLQLSKQGQNYDPIKFVKE